MLKISRIEQENVTRFLVMANRAQPYERQAAYWFLFHRFNACQERMSDADIQSAVREYLGE